MARASKVEACIFCGCLPCECNGPAKKKSTKKRAVPFGDRAHEPGVETVNLLDETKPMREAMKAAASAPPSEPERETLDPELVGPLAVLIASGILHQEEVERYKPLIPKTARATAWKERNNGMAR